MVVIKTKINREGTVDSRADTLTTKETIVRIRKNINDAHATPAYCSYCGLLFKANKRIAAATEIIPMPEKKGLYVEFGCTYFFNTPRIPI